MLQFNIENIKFNVEEKDDINLIEFILDGPIEPKILSEIEEKLKTAKINPKKPTVISGRGPVWLFLTIAHVFHYTVAVSSYDPRIGAVVVQSHSPKYSVGQVFDITL